MKSEVCLSAYHEPSTSKAQGDALETCLQSLADIMEPIAEEVRGLILAIFHSEGVQPHIKGRALDVLLHHGRLRESQMPQQMKEVA